MAYDRRRSPASASSIPATHIRDGLGAAQATLIAARRPRLPRRRAARRRPRSRSTPCARARACCGRSRPTRTRIRPRWSAGCSIAPTWSRWRRASARSSSARRRARAPASSALVVETRGAAGVDWSWRAEQRRHAAVKPVADRRHHRRGRRVRRRAAAASHARPEAPAGAVAGRASRGAVRCWPARGEEEEASMTERAWYLNCGAEDVGDRAILVGDRGRVARIAERLDDVRWLNEDRGLTTATGPARRPADHGQRVRHGRTDRGGRPARAARRSASACSCGSGRSMALTRRCGWATWSSPTGRCAARRRPPATCRAGYPAVADHELVAAAARRRPRRPARAGTPGIVDVPRRLLHRRCSGAPSAIACCAALGVLALDMETSAVLAIGRALGARAGSLCVGDGRRALERRGSTPAERGEAEDIARRGRAGRAPAAAPTGGAESEGTAMSVDRALPRHRRRRHRADPRHAAGGPIREAGRACAASIAADRLAFTFGTGHGQLRRAGVLPAHRHAGRLPADRRERDRQLPPRAGRPGRVPVPLPARAGGLSARAILRAHRLDAGDTMRAVLALRHQRRHPGHGHCVPGAGDDRRRGDLDPALVRASRRATPPACGCSRRPTS